MRAYVHYLDWMDRRETKEIRFNTRVTPEVRRMITELARADSRSDADWLEVTVRRLYKETLLKPTKAKP